MNANTATDQLHPNQNKPQDLGESLVNKYASIKGRIDELKIEQKELQTELESLEEDIIIYAKEKRTQQIFAGDNIIDIKETVIRKFPLAGEKGRVELEEIIKKVGAWETVSTLSLSKLKSFVWYYRDTHQVLVKELLRFQKRTMKTTVKLVKMVYDKRC